MIKVNVETTATDPTFLSGRYSQTFVDEMARQLTYKISEAMSVKGVESGAISLSLVFAPATYMEHTSENQTYRRLLITDGTSAPRDFWVKWTRLKSDIEVYSEDNILFELGEDVDQKIREKEYRYLLASGNEKYHNSMGRKKVTEWREVIKRAAKRGEITRIESDFELAPETLELEERIADLLGKRTADRVGYEKAEIPIFTRMRASSRPLWQVFVMWWRNPPFLRTKKFGIRNSKFEMKKKAFPLRRRWRRSRRMRWSPKNLKSKLNS
jgi:hypothetical protein